MAWDGLGSVGLGGKETTESLTKVAIRTTYVTTPDSIQRFESTSQSYSDLGSSTESMTVTRVCVFTGRPLLTLFSYALII